MQTSALMCSVKWLPEFACRRCHVPVTLVKNACMQTWCVPLCSSWAKSSSSLCVPKEHKCSPEPVSDLALKWIKIMHKIQSVSVAQLVMSRTGSTLDYFCLSELLGMFEELGNWGRENYKEWGSLGTSQNCAVIFGPSLLPVCLQCRAKALWARPKPLALWDTWVLMMDWGDQSQCRVLWSASLSSQHRAVKLVKWGSQYPCKYNYQQWNREFRNFYFPKSNLRFPAVLLFIACLVLLPACFTNGAVEGASGGISGP